MTNPKRSKFLPVYACIRDLHVLILCGISYAITHGEVIVDHGQNREIITYYRARFNFAIGRFEHPEHGELFQFDLCIIFHNFSLANAFPFGNGYKVCRRDREKEYKALQSAGAGDAGTGAGDACGGAEASCEGYPSGDRSGTRHKISPCPGSTPEVTNTTVHPAKKRRNDIENPEGSACEKEQGSCRSSSNNSKSSSASSKLAENVSFLN